MRKKLFALLLVITTIQFMASAQERDPRVRTYITPTRIVWTQHNDLIQQADKLLLPGTGQADLVNNRITYLKSSNGRHPAILLDFGKELHGGLQIVTGMPADHTPVRLRIRFGESVSEAMCEIDTIHGATNDHAVRDMITEVPWLGVKEMGNTGFRFVRIDLVDDNVELHLKEVRAISVMRDLEYVGSFKCNDTLLNKIWETGAYTVHLNMQEYIWDGIKRDRLVWIGDLHPEVMTVNTVFGYNEVIPKSLDFMKEITPLPNWMNGMCSYSIWWLMIQRDWYYYQGNKDYLLAQKDYIEGLLKQLIASVDKQGVEQLSGGTRFLDWPSSDNAEAIHVGLQALVIQALKCGTELMEVLGNNELSKECSNTVVRMQKAAGKVSKQFLTTLKSADEPGAKQVAALMALSGLMPAKEAAQKYLMYRGAHGFSTFFGYYMLNALALAGEYEEALHIIRSYWGEMLRLGATTFWEDFNLDWVPGAAGIDELVPEGMKDIHGDFGDYCYKGFRHSLCHGWASGPTAWLSQYVLGVNVVVPGCQELKIVPHLGNLQWVEGTFPTPYGTVYIRHERQADGSIKSDIQAPKGVKINKEVY